MRIATLLAIFFVFSNAYAKENTNQNNAPSLTHQRDHQHEAPQWYLEDMAFLTRDGGRWVASNAEYVRENEPMESFVLEWKAGYANSMTGRLFAIVDGKETGDFWRFRQYWHPGEGKAVIEQFGFGGAVGLGVMWREGDKLKTEQTFYAPESAPQLQGHVTYNPDADTHVTESYNIVDGEWQANRTYTWQHQAPAEDG